MRDRALALLQELESHGLDLRGPRRSLFIRVLAKHLEASAAMGLPAYVDPDDPPVAIADATTQDGTDLGKPQLGDGKILDPVPAGASAEDLVVIDPEITN